MPTFDGDNLIMTLDAPVAGVLSLDTQADLYSEWKKWQVQDDNLRYEAAFDIVISEELTPGIESGAYFFFRNDLGWRCRPFEADASVYLNGNLVPRDSTLPIMIPTIGAYTVLVDGLQPITQNVDTILTSLESSTYARDLGVTIDPSIAADPTGSEILGNGDNPVKTEELMHTLLLDRGFDFVFVKSALNLYKDHSIGHTFVGANAQKVVMNIGDVATYPLKDISACKFDSFYITGEFDTLNEIRECIVAPITNANGFIYKSTIIGPIVVLAGTSLSLEECWTATPGADNIIDFNNVASTVAITDWSGGTIQVINMVAGCVFGMGGTAGSFKLAASCTGGSVNYGGAIRLKEDLSSGVTFNDATTATQVWDKQVEGTFTAEEVMRIMSSALAGKASGLDTLSPIFRDISDSKNRITATTDANGNRSAVTVDAT